MLSQKSSAAAIVARSGGNPAPVFDVANVQSRQTTRGAFELQCPACGRWAPALFWRLAGPGPACWECGQRSAGGTGQRAAIGL